MTDTPPGSILRALRPIADPGAGSPARGLSNAERRRREKHSKAQRAATGESPQTGEGKPKALRKGHLSTQEAGQMVADIARVNHAVASNPTESASNRRFAAIAVGVSVDKKLALDSRSATPTVLDTEPARLARLALWRRLLGLPAAETAQT